jgi:DNA-binding CsgD family transcriptional regulator
MSALFAAAHRERTAALIMIGGYARRLWAPDYPAGVPREERLRFVEHVEKDWGADLHIGARAPSLVHDERFRAWWATYLRMSASPGAAAELTRMNMEIDIRDILPAVRVPTLVMHRVEDQTVLVGNGRYLAERISGARYVELPGADHLPFSGDQEAILREIEVFLTGELPVLELDRVLATLMITGIVGAAATAVRLGDHAWSDIVAAHDAIVREQLARFRGREVKKTLGGVLAAFDGPARAIRCACGIVEATRDLGISVRAGLHAGECEQVDGELAGVALHITERVFDRAAPGEVLVSSTVKDLVAGSGIEFEEMESRLLTGPASGWRLHRVVAGSRPAALAADVTEATRAPTALSPREREVAILVAQGRSNRQIAGDLSISPATVERHVANILGKLGFNSRAQIAAWAVGHDLLHPGDA